MDNLIFDRLKSDVDTALSNPENTSFLKGAYNYTDLNRELKSGVISYKQYYDIMAIKKNL